MVDSDSDTETVNESCWKWKLLRFTSNHRSNFQQLISQGDSAVESVVLESPSSQNLDHHHSNLSNISHSQNQHHLSNSNSSGSVSTCLERGPGDKCGRVRPRSAGDISESLRAGGVILHGSVSPTESHQTNNQHHHHATSVTTNIANNSSSQTSGGNHNSSGTGGGILSFFGVRFNKSGTRHLDRSSGDRQRIQNDSSSDKPPGKTLDRDHRYTKFPLTSPSQLPLSVISGPQSQNPSIPTSISNPSIAQSNIQSVPLHTDAPFDATHIQLTPQTITYAHPHKSPVPPVKGTIHGANSNKFLINAVSSLGRRSKDNCVVPQQVVPLPTKVSGHKSSGHSNLKLKVKSKSDNSLHRVNLNSSNSSGGSSNNNNTGRNVLSPNSYPQGEQRLNSVQLGDHATIRLPWTGFQRQHLNNLSTVTPPRPHPNTHNNNFGESGESAVRYVECGVWSGTHSVLPSTVVSGSSSGPARDLPRRRARSLERTSNFRIFPVNSGAHLALSPGKSKGQKDSSKSTSSSTSSAKNHIQVKSQSNSLERPSRHRIRQSLSPGEQEILLRNLTFSRVTNQIGLLVDIPPALPKKKSKSNSNNFKPPPLGKLHRSAPNSSFSSVESSSNSSSSGDLVASLGGSGSSSVCRVLSAPPSPPPRPPSTLKPESRLIGAPSAANTNTTNSSPLSRQQPNPNPNQPPPPPAKNPKQQQQSPCESQSGRTINGSNNSNCSSNSCNNSSGNCATMNSSGSSSSSSANRRPVVPRSSGGASDPRSRLSPTHQEGQMSQTTNSSGSVASGMSLEDARNSGFINKPSKGWLHSDQLLSKEGVTYTVRYIGCLDVNTSMKSLDFDTRSLIAKECINHVCEAAGLKSVDKKRKTDRRVIRILGLRPRLDQAGSDVHLTITSTCLKLTSLDTGAVIATHDLPNISFASGGDATMLDFVAYVAKDAVVGRACFVLECGSGRAQDVITTVGQAFELRFKEYLQKRPAPPPRVQTEDPDREYYNDLPGKLPPESTGTSAAAAGVSRTGLSALTSASADQKSLSAKGTVGSTGRRTTPALTLPTSPNDNKDGMSVNLIDFEAPTPPAFGPSSQDRNLEALLLSGGGLVPTSPTHKTPAQMTSSSAPVTHGSFGDGHRLHQHSNNGLASPGHSSKDPFNMQPFGNSIPVSNPISPAEQKAQLEEQKWFHGIISRGEAEALVRNDGDFLVRESQATPGQYVLTGLQNGSSKHLLLMDPEGVVRTKDREFDSVLHLIRYHSDNSLPIISAESMVLLRHPVPRPTQVISSSSS